MNTMLESKDVVPEQLGKVRFPIRDVLLFFAYMIIAAFYHKDTTTKHMYTKYSSMDKLCDRISVAMLAKINAWHLDFKVFARIFNEDAEINLQMFNHALHTYITLLTNINFRELRVTGYGLHFIMNVADGYFDCTQPFWIDRYEKCTFSWKDIQDIFWNLRLDTRRYSGIILNMGDMFPLLKEALDLRLEIRKLIIDYFKYDQKH